MAVFFCSQRRRKIKIPNSSLLFAPSSCRCSHASLWFLPALLVLANPFLSLGGRLPADSYPVNQWVTNNPVEVEVSARAFHTSSPASCDVLGEAGSYFVYGGLAFMLNSLVPLDDIYKYDNDHLDWTRYASSGNPVFMHSTVTVCLGTQKIILTFGGVGGSATSPTVSSALYAFNITGESWAIWASGAALAPQGRFGHSMAVYHPVSGKMLLQNPLVFVFGGASFPNETLFNDLWMFDTNTMAWSNLTVLFAPEAPYPMPRFGASMSVYNDTLFLFGGCAGFSDPYCLSCSCPMATGSYMWMLNLTNVKNATEGSLRWTRVLNNALNVTLSFAASALVYSPAESYSTAASENITSMAGSSLSMNREGRAVDAPVSQQSVVWVFYGGVQNQSMNSLLCEFSFDSLEWRLALVPHGVELPLFRVGSSMSGGGHYAWLFGGINYVSFLSDMWLYFPLEHLWVSTAPITVPSPRSFQSGVLVKDQFIIFGGNAVAPRSPLSDTWVFDIAVSVWKHLYPDQSPPFRSEHSSFVFRNQKYIAFGYDSFEGVYYNDMWFLNLEFNSPRYATWQAVSYNASGLLSLPAPRSLVSLTSYQDTVLLFGGQADSLVFKDTWQFNLSTHVWRELTVLPDLTQSSPVPRCGHSASIFYNRYFFLFGGVNPTTRLFFNDVWLIDMWTRPLRWMQLVPLPSSSPFSPQHSPFISSTSSLFINGSQLMNRSSGSSGSLSSRPNLSMLRSIDKIGSIDNNNTAPQPFPRAFHASTSISLSKILIQGGASSMRQEFYDGALNDSWVGYLILNTTNLEVELYWEEISTSNILPLMGSTLLRIDRNDSKGQNFEDPLLPQLLLFGGQSDFLTDKAFTNEIWNSAVGCNAGSFSLDFSADHCFACPTAQYSFSPGSTFCFNCPIGTTTKTVGSNSAGSCDVCDKDFCHRGSCAVYDYAAHCDCSFGFTGDRCDNEWGYMAGGVLLALCLLVTGVILILLYKKRKSNANKYNLLPSDSFLEDTREDDEESFFLRAGWNIRTEDVRIIRKYKGSVEAECWVANWEGLSSRYPRNPRVLLKYYNERVEEFPEQKCRDFEKEIRSLRLLKHKNVVRFFGPGLWCGHPYILTEFLSRGSLRDLLANADLNLEWSRLLQFSLDCAEGTAYLHTSNQAHGQLSTMCLYVNDAGVLKVGGFGLEHLRRDYFASPDSSSRMRSYTASSTRSQNNNTPLPILVELKATSTSSGLKKKQDVSDLHVGQTAHYNPSAHLLPHSNDSHGVGPLRHSVHSHSDAPSFSINNVDDFLANSRESSPHPDSVSGHGHPKEIHPANHMIPSSSAHTHTVSLTRAVFFAPEVLRGDALELASDVYSFGLIMWEICIRKSPFTEYASIAELQTAVAHGVRPRLPTPLECSSPEFIELMQDCWAQDPDTRPKFETVVLELQKLYFYV